MEDGTSAECFSDFAIQVTHVLFWVKVQSTEEKLSLPKLKLKSLFSLFYSENRVGTF